MKKRTWTELLSYYLPSPVLFFVPTHSSLFNTSDSYLKSVRLKLISVSFSGSLLDIGGLEKSFPESIV